MTHGTSPVPAQPTPAEPSLLDQYANASQQSRDIARDIGPGYDEDPRWRASERTAEHLWTQAKQAGHTTAELLDAARPAC